MDRTARWPATTGLTASERPERLRSARRAVSPWLDLLEHDVRFPGQAGIQTYHSLGQVETVGILAIGPDGRVPIIRQYRPAIDAFVWELPAGMVDEGDTPEACCRRELEEEVGLRAVDLVDLGSAWPDTGRLSYRHHSWMATRTEVLPGFTPEPGTDVAWVELQELYRGIVAGHFPHQLHVAVIMRALLAGLIPSPYTSGQDET